MTDINKAPDEAALASLLKEADEQKCFSGACHEKRCLVCKLASALRQCLAQQSATEAKLAHAEDCLKAGRDPMVQAQLEIMTNRAKQAEALLSATEEAAFKAGWQPIETAPKETQLLLSDGYRVYWGHYSVVHRMWLGSAADDFTYSGPTHWQPLPPPHVKAGSVQP